MDRRQLQKALGVGAVTSASVLLTQACAPAAPASKPAEAQKPAEAAKPAAARAKPAEAAKWNLDRAAIVWTTPVSPESFNKQGNAAFARNPVKVQNVRESVAGRNSFPGVWLA